MYMYENNFIVDAKIEINIKSDVVEPKKEVKKSGVERNDEKSELVSAVKGRERKKTSQIRYINFFK